jgi:hypothetical protein
MTKPLTPAHKAAIRRGLKRANAAKQARNAEHQLVNGDSLERMTVSIKGKNLSTILTGTYFQLGVALGRLFGFRNESK